MKIVRMKTHKEYNVIIDYGLLNRAGDYIYSAIGGDIAAIVTDDMVSSLYLERLRTSLKTANYQTAVFTLRNGEASKNVFTYSRVLEFLAENRITKSDVVVALGGGVVGDIASFAAATYMQGIPYAQIPTTLIAAVDSSIGGKTALNLDAGKNLVGAFHQPGVVLCDLEFLEKLPPRVFVEGCASVIKFAMIADDGLFHMLGNGNSLELKEIVARCVELKRDIVCEDELENGARSLLDFGHTIGHAIEHLSKYKISHGKATSIGMATETMAAVRLGMCDEECYDSLVGLLHKFGLPIRTRFEADEVLRAAMTDKKRNGESMTLVFPRRIGKCILSSVNIEKYERIIKERTSAAGGMV